MKLTVHGTGYVGLVTGACMADAGNHVVCVDIDPDKVSRLQQGEVPIYEPGLDGIVRRNIRNGRIRFTTDVAEGVAHGALQFIAVGTPPDEDGSADMQYVLEVAGSIGRHMKDYKLIINKSTVPVGTADRVRSTVAAEQQKRGSAIDFDVASNPEFLKEGAAVNDFMKPDRIILGADTERARELVRELYEPFNRNHDRLIVMDVRSAELTKYAANAMLATKISFMNELAGLAEKLDADIENVRIGIGSDPRIGYEFIYPGCGFGGSCFPKDVRALVHIAGEIGAPADLIDAVQTVNERQKSVLFAKLSRHFAGDLRGKRVALWGLAFKPNTDDMREAPSRVFIAEALAAGAAITAYDPVAQAEAQRVLPADERLRYSDSAEAASDGADAVVIVTEWREFRSPDFERMRVEMRTPVVIDGRNLYDPQQMRERGFAYYAVGRGL